MISNYPFVSCMLYSMVYEKHFTQCQYDINFLYPTSHVYNPSYTKTKTKVEILFYNMNLESKAS